MIVMIMDRQAQDTRGEERAIRVELWWSVVWLSCRLDGIIADCIYCDREQLISSERVQVVDCRLGTNGGLLLGWVDLDLAVIISGVQPTSRKSSLNEVSSHSSTIGCPLNKVKIRDNVQTLLRSNGGQEIDWQCL